MCWDYGDETWPLGDGTRTARKPHRCANGCRIDPGDSYHYWTAVDGEQFVAVKWCDPCEVTGRHLGDACRLYYEDSADPPIGELWHELQAHVMHDLADNGVEWAVIDALAFELAALAERRAAP